MKSLILALLIVLPSLIGYSQLEKLKYDVSYYEDEVNEVNYVAGRTEDNKLVAMKLDKNFNVTKEITSSFTVAGDSKVWIDLKVPVFNFREVVNGEVINEFHFNEDFEEGEVKIDNKKFITKNYFCKGNLVFKYKYQHSDAVDNLKRFEKYNKKDLESDFAIEMLSFHRYTGPLELICYERNSSELNKLWTGNINTNDILDFQIFDVTEDYIYCYTQTDVNDYMLYKFDIKNKNVVKTKIIKTDFDSESTKSEIKYDKYRKQFYVGFVESLGVKNKEQYANIKIHTIDEKFEDVGSPIVNEVIFSKEDCKAGFVKGTFEDGRYSDNKTEFLISKSGVNIQITHSTTLELGPSNGSTNKLAGFIGITDITIYDKNVKLNFYDKEFIIDYYFRDFSHNPGYLVVENFRNKILRHGKPVFVIANTHGTGLSLPPDTPPSEIEYTDLKSRKVLKECDKFKLDRLDDFTLIKTNSSSKHSYGTEYIVSDDENTVLWIYATEFEKKYNVPINFSVVIDKLDW